MATLNRFIPIYLEHIRARSSPGWHKSQRIYLRTHVEPVWGRRDLRRITPNMLESLIRKWLKSARPTTVNKRLSCLRKFFDLALERGLVETNPARQVESLPDDTRIHDETITPEEFARLTAHARPKLRMFLFLGYHTGVRAGEARALTWRDIDLDDRMLRVRGLKAGKGQRIKLRWIPVNAELLRELRAFRELPEGRHQHLFEHNGTPDWAALNTTFRAAVIRAGLEEGRWITPHTLRHTFGSELARAGLPMRRLQLLMGHSSVLVTERWYAHHSPDHLRGATDVLQTPAMPRPSGVKT